MLSQNDQLVQHRSSLIGRAYVLASEGHENVIVASSCHVEEYEGDIFESPFDW